MTMQDEQTKIIQGDGAATSGRVLIFLTPRLSRQDAFAQIKNYPALPMNLTDAWISSIISSNWLNGPFWFYSYNSNTYNNAALVLHPTGLITAIPDNVDALCGFMGYLE
ncbi:hypothetical protein Aple_045480 [Acrocarpospora pleiomorpha]|uniref:Uncharacterized protein n=1 Tax=Acrocarpospora pleiomorpha TaxID=90975 RepID=A0A5M3XL96_9ACTN|nr:hypothetical protein [Acrocarpospora pleiomorpha]GES21652.1 hypothetical protein Aple_045480 [Acrocarpospora pleiomorpha]